MNERIKELIGQATTSEKGPPILNGYASYNSEIILFNKEKFAELIVRECFELVRFNSNGAGQEILEHFGVTE